MPAEIKITEEDLKKIEAMAGLGIKWKDIATVMEMSYNTLLTKCKETLKKGRIKSKINLIGKANDMAMRGNTAMMIFLLKTRHQMREKSKIEITQKNSDRLNLNDVIKSMPSDPNEAMKIYQKIMSEK